MAYKHEKDVMDAVDFMKPSYGTEKHQEIQQELADVYRKAEVFDEMADIMKNNKRLHNTIKAKRVIDRYKKWEE